MTGFQSNFHSKSEVKGFRVAYMDMDVLIETRSKLQNDGIEEIFAACPPASELCIAQDLAHTENKPMANVGVMVNLLCDGSLLRQRRSKVIVSYSGSASFAFSI